MRSANPAAVELPPTPVQLKRPNADYFVAIERKPNNRNAPKTVDLLRMFHEYNEILGEKELNQIDMQIDYVPGNSIFSPLKHSIVNDVTVTSSLPFRMHPNFDRCESPSQSCVKN